MENSKISGRVVCTLAASCLAVVLSSGLAFAQPAAGKKEAADGAMPPGLVVPESAVQTLGVAPVPQGAAGTASDKAADSPAEKFAEKTSEKTSDYWVPTLFGDMGGLRPALARNGVTLGLTEVSEWLKNTSGGVKTGQAYHGLTTLTLGLDTQQAGGLDGGSVNLSVLHIHGRQLSPDYIGSLQTASGIEALSGPRLWELWYQQKLTDRLDVKLGQQSLDQEFMVSQYAGTFVGTAFGWPTVPSSNLPAGGPAYPLSSPGARLRVRVGESVTLLAGMFAGDPANTSIQDPQKANNRGTTFSLHGGTLSIAELQYGLNQPGPTGVDAVNQRGLPGMYKIGAWYQNGKFSDTRFDTGGLSLASPGGSGRALQHAGNYSVYAVADQTVWGDSAGGPQAVNLFARAMVAPGDRNPVSMSANLGVTMTAPFAGRDNDVLGLGIGYVKVGSNARGLDGDNNGFRAINSPIRNSEAFVEATYQYQATPWLVLQSVLQYTRNPGAGVVDPGDPSQTRRIANSTVLGLRANLTF